jgi:hypothetical protein
MEEKDHSSIADCSDSFDSWTTALNLKIPSLPSISDLKDALCEVASDTIDDAIDEITVSLSVDLSDDVSAYLE